MGKAARAHAQSRKERRERLRRKFPFAAQTIIEDRAVARMLVKTAPLARVLIEEGITSTPDLGVESFDAGIAIIKDALGMVRLTDEEFEHALRLSTVPECREMLQ